MACDLQELKHVPLFALLDDEEAAVLASQVEMRRFAPRQRIYKMGDPSGLAYVMISGRVRVSTVDEDHQEVTVDEPAELGAVGDPALHLGLSRAQTIARRHYLNDKIRANGRKSPALFSGEPGQRLIRGEELDGRVEPEAVAAGVLRRLDREAKALLREVINATVYVRGEAIPVFWVDQIHEDTAAPAPASK